MSHTTNANTAYPNILGGIGFYTNTDRKNTPASADGYIVSFRWHSALYVTQLYIDDAHRDVYMRSLTDTWSDWKKLSA